jgi:hypothetical protein
LYAYGYTPTPTQLSPRRCLHRPLHRPLHRAPGAPRPLLSRHHRFHRRHRRLRGRLPRHRLPRTDPVPMLKMPMLATIPRPRGFLFLPCAAQSWLSNLTNGVLGVESSKKLPGVDIRCHAC